MILLAPGSIFAQRYRVLRIIGQGGMGAVFEVVHVETERHCALKVMQPNMVDNDVMRARFRQEAKVAALVNSEHIVDVYDAGFDEETQMPFLVMELLTGIELRKKLKIDGKLRPDEVALYMHQTALALEKTHRANIIHRDLKPENLYLTFREDGSPHIKILDFGVAKFTTESISNTSATRDVGTPLYMGPEQFTMGAKPSPQTDIYALAMIAYTLLVGITYWADDQQVTVTIYAFAMHAVKGPPEPASVRAKRRGVELPAAFDNWFARATARDPQKRFPSALQAANELADALGVPRFRAENSLSMSNVGIRSAIGSTTSGAPRVLAMGTNAGAVQHPESGHATGAPLATTAGTKKESKGKVVIAAAGAAILTAALGGVLLFGGGNSSSKTNAAASTTVATAQPSAANKPIVSIAPPPIVEPVSEPIATQSASALAPASTKTKSKSTGPAKPIVTGTAPKKDLFTRD